MAGVFAGFRVHEYLKPALGVLAAAALLISIIAYPVRSAPPPVDARDAIWLPGINLASGEFEPSRSRPGKDYEYPTTAEIDYFANKGFRVFRIPFLAARFVQPTLTLGARLRPEVEDVEKLIAHAGRRDAYVILDMHDYGKMFTSGLIGKDDGATEEFAQAWRLIAERMKDYPNVMFGIMNEPNKQSAAEWLQGANAAIAAIRDAGATQLILVPGSYWSGAHSWTRNDNHEVMLGVEDPAGNFVYEAHQYLNTNSSGTKPDVVPGAGSQRLEAFTGWARKNNVRAFLGEFGWADTPEAHVEGDALLAYMSANRDVWMGWAYWAAGPRWGNYMFSVEPDAAGADKPQMRVLEKYID